MVAQPPRVDEVWLVKVTLAAPCRFHEVARWSTPTLSLIRTSGSMNSPARRTAATLAATSEMPALFLRVGSRSAVGRRRQNGPGLHVHGDFHLVGQGGVAVLHPCDLSIRVVRVLPVVVGGLLFPLPVHPPQGRHVVRAHPFDRRKPLQIGRVALPGVPPHDGLHGRVGLQRGRVHPDRLPLDQTTPGHFAQDPVENRLVDFRLQQPPRPRQRAVVERGLVQPDGQRGRCSGRWRSSGRCCAVAGIGIRMDGRRGWVIRGRAR